MNNWIDAIILTASIIAGLYGIYRVNISRYLTVMAAAGLAMSLSLGFYEYLGAAWGDTSFTHGSSLLLLVALAILAFIPARKWMRSKMPEGAYGPESFTVANRTVSGLALFLSAGMFFSIIMAFMVKLSAWILEADDISRSAEIFVNGIIGSAIVRRMDSMAGYPAIIIGAAITLIGMTLNLSRLVERLSPEETRPDDQKLNG